MKFLRILDRGRDASATKGRSLLWCGRPARNLPIRFSLVTTVVIAFLFGGGAFAAEEVILRTSVVPEDAWVGQRALLRVEVLGADGWAKISDVGEVEIPGTYVMRTQSQGTRLSETIGGTGYTGQRYELSLYCQRPGRVKVPSVPVTVSVKQWGVNATEDRHEMLTPVTTFSCAVPPGAEGIRGLISTTSLDADQTWSSEPQELAPGDAITRTVELSAEDVSGMAFPPMQHPELEGVGIYPGEPSVSDSTDRGSLRGERVETVTYFCEQPGEVALPGIVISWWDIDDRVLRRTELPGLSFEVIGEIAEQPAAKTVEEEATAQSPRDRARLVVAAVALVALGIWFGRKLGDHFRKWWHARKESEAAYFARVAVALHGRDPATISSAVISWLDRLEPGVRPARLDLFLRDHGDDDTRKAAAMLARCLATGESFTEAQTLGRGLKKARNHFRRSRHHEQRAANVLPELNGPRWSR